MTRKIRYTYKSTDHDRTVQSIYSPKDFKRARSARDIAAYEKQLDIGDVKVLEVERRILRTLCPVKGIGCECWYELLENDQLQSVTNCIQRRLEIEND